MEAKKHITLRLIILMLLAVTILMSCGRDNMYSEYPSFNFSELIENENVEDISLTIYYVNPSLLTLIPWSVDNLISSTQTKKIVVNGSDLEKHIDLFNQISNDDLISVKKQSNINARMYYVLESKKNGKLFDVAMWGSDGDDNSMFVNGVEVKENDIFYDIVMPFLPEDATKEFDKWIDREEVAEDSKLE